MANRNPKITIRADDKTKTAFKSVTKNLGRLKNSVFNVGTGIATLVGVAGFGALIKSTIDSADEIQKLSIRLGASSEALSEYRHVAELTGVEFRTLSIGMQRMTRRIAEAAQGTGEARNAIRELNLDAQKLNALPLDQKFEVIADRLNGVKNEADKVRLAMKLFDSEGVSLIQTMDGGSKAIKEMRDEARKLGLSLSQEQVDAAADAKDAFTRLQGSAQGLANTLLVELGGSLAETIDDFANSLPESLKLAKAAMDSFWLAIDPKKASLGAQAREMSEEIYRLTQEVIGFENQIKGGMDGPLWGFDEKIEERRQQIDELQVEYQALTDQIQASNDRGLTVGIQKKDEATVDPVIEHKKAQTFALQEQEELQYQMMLAYESRKFEAVQNWNIALSEWQQKNAKQKTKSVIGEAIALTQGVAGQSRALFEINKAAGIGNALINTYEGVSETLSKYPWPLAGAMAALHLASGIAQVNAIKGATFGGSGGAPSLAASGGTPSNPVFQDPASSAGSTQGQTEPTQININIDGNLYANDDFRNSIVEAIDRARDLDEIADVRIVSNG